MRPHPKPRLLAVDDDTDILKMLQVVLRDEYELETAESAGQALRKAEEFAPDLLLLDLILPDKDGLELLEELRKLDGLGDTPAIFLTGVTDKAKLREVLDQGIEYYITKPFEPDELAARIRQALHASGIGPPEETD